MRTIGLYHKWQMAHIFLFRTRLCESAAATMSFKITKNLLKFIHKMNPEPTTHQPNVLIPFKWFAFRFIFVTLNNLLCISNAHKVHFFRVALSFFLLNLWLQSTDTYVNHTNRSPAACHLSCIRSKSHKCTANISRCVATDTIDLWAICLVSLSVSLVRFEEKNWKEAKNLLNYNIMLLSIWSHVIKPFLCTNIAWCFYFWKVNWNSLKTIGVGVLELGV